MWKKTDLKQASYKDIEFDFIDIEDCLKKTIAKYDYPYADGSELEDMGLESRTVKMKVVFMNERYVTLESFIDVLKEQGVGEVVHPVFGTFKAIPETVSIKHDERAYYAEIDISFTEHKDVSVVVPVQSAEGKIENIAENNNRTAALMKDSMNESLNKVRGVMKKIDSFVGKIKAYINDASAPFKLITSTISYLTNLPGSILSSIAGAIESVAGEYQSLLNAPGKFVDSVNFGLKKIEKALGKFEDKRLKAAWDVSKAIALVTAVGLEMKIDERVEKVGSQGLGRAIVSLDKYGGGEVQRTQLMTITEIDSVAAVARESVKEAIVSVRDAFGIETKEANEIERILKVQALIIQQTADEIRLRRERIIEYEVASDMPLHLLAFNLYGNINEAERLMRINNIRNPNFLKAGDVVRVYA